MTDDPIRITWTWSEDDHVRALRTHHKFNKQERRLRILLPVTGALLLIFWLAFEADTFVIALTAAYVVLALFVLGRMFFTPWWARKVYRQQRALHRPLTLKIDGEGLRSSQEDGGQGVLKWSDCHRWIDGPDDFMVYPSDAFFHLIPKRLLSDEEVRRVRQILAVSVPR